MYIKTKKNKKYFRNKRSCKKCYKGGQFDEKAVFIQLPKGEGLGNQLFVYAAGVVIKEYTGLPLYIIKSQGNPHSKTDYTYLFKQGKAVKLVDVQDRINKAKPIHNAFESHEKWKPTDTPLNKSSNVLLKGRLYHHYPSTISAIPSIKKELEEEFQTKWPELKNNIVQEKTACIHVRRGDFVKPVGINKNQYCFESTTEYFQKSIDLLEKNTNITTIYIVSNDIPWCKEQNWKSTKEIKYFEDPDELKTLYLMMLCKGGFVLSATSTYSSWGAMLGADTNPDSTIITAIEWKNKFEPPERWIALRANIRNNTYH